MYLGFVVFICGWVFQTVQIGASLPYSPQYYYSKTNRYGRLFFWCAGATLHAHRAAVRRSDPARTQGCCA